MAGIRADARVVAGTIGLMIGLSAPLDAQHAHESTRPTLRAGAHGVVLLTRVSPILAGADKTEAYFTQPALMAELSLFERRLEAVATVSLEPLTLERGELGAGSFGEGYVDRRHPHTYLHELMLTAMRDIGPVTASLSVGRGFVPFGSDDPMMRPFVKFPVNHHLGQILERLVGAAGVRIGPLLAEAGLFNGDEPSDETDWGTVDRFGDSWAGRLTLLPVNGLELQLSRAWVVSPEFPFGGGLDQRKWSTSARYAQVHGDYELYGLAEWKRTTEVSLGRDIFSFGSALVELEVARGGWRPALRIERSERPEEDRTADPFRTPWPHADTHVLGITRWIIVAARLQRDTGYRGLRVSPFVEASYSDVRETANGLFDPNEFYGATKIWTFNIGARLGVGTHRMRMGRYGVASLDQH